MDCLYGNRKSNRVFIVADVLKEKCTQINIPGILGKRNKEIGGNKVDSKRRN